MNFLLSLLVLFIVAAFGIFGSWKLGQFIRKRGGGPTLDKMAKFYDKFQPMLGPKSNALSNLSASFNKITFNRSKDTKKGN